MHSKHLSWLPARLCVEDKAIGVILKRVSYNDAYDWNWYIVRPEVDEVFSKCFCTYFMEELNKEIQNVRGNTAAKLSSTLMILITNSNANNMMLNEEVYIIMPSFIFHLTHSLRSGGVAKTGKHRLWNEWHREIKKMDIVTGVSSKLWSKELA